MSKKWLLRRLGFMLIVFLAALVINFAIPRLMPAGAVDLYTKGAKLSPAAQESIIRKFGLDKSVWEQFWLYVANIFRGEFGLSFFYYPTPVSTLVFRALPWTLFLLISAELLSVPIGYFLGVIAGWKAGSKTDSTIQGFSLFLLSTPLFWIGMILLFVFGYQLGWFPLSGAYTIAASYPNVFVRLYDYVRHAVLPVLSLVTIFGVEQLVMRNTMVTTIREQYVLIAKAKGQTPTKVKFNHAARNALLPLVTSVGLRFATLVGGSVFVEKVFSYPGIGQLIFNAVLNVDYPVLQAAFLIYSITTIAVVFLLDIVYVYLDPRIRY